MFIKDLPHSIHLQSVISRIAHDRLKRQRNKGSKKLCDLPKVSLLGRGRSGICNSNLLTLSSGSVYFSMLPLVKQSGLGARTQAGKLETWFLFLIIKVLGEWGNDFTFLGSFSYL